MIIVYISYKHINMNQMQHCCLFSVSRILEHAQWSRAGARRRLWATVGHFVDPRFSMTEKQRHWRSKREEARSVIHWHLYNPSFVFDCQYMENVSEKHSSKNSRWTTLMQALTAFAKVVPSNQALKFSWWESCTNDCPKQELSVPTTLRRRHNLLEMSPWCATPKGAYFSTFCRRQLEKPVSWTVSVPRGVFGFSGNCSSCRKPKILIPSVPAMKASVAAVHCLYGDMAKARQRDIGDWQQIRMPRWCHWNVCHVPMKPKPCKLEGVLGKMHAPLGATSNIENFMLNSESWTEDNERSRDQEHWQLKYIAPRDWSLDNFLPFRTQRLHMFLCGRITNEDHEGSIRTGAGGVSWQDFPASCAHVARNRWCGLPSWPSG